MSNIRRDINNTRSMLKEPWPLVRDEMQTHFNIYTVIVFDRRYAGRF